MNALPEIDESELKAVRRFLTSLRDEERRARLPQSPESRGNVALRSGIARARSRPRAPVADATTSSTGRTPTAD
ncbi:MAG TPA: hypothetical protein VG406_16885 [Isosphaeraceae bacterium]|jgi:hypothetical protein|nr:hypothetical protein [Isosphaeraceae bacterium]